MRLLHSTQRARLLALCLRVLGKEMGLRRRKPGGKKRWSQEVAWGKIESRIQMGMCQNQIESGRQGIEWRHRPFGEGGNTASGCRAVRRLRDVSCMAWPQADRLVMGSQDLASLVGPRLGCLTLGSHPKLLTTSLLGTTHWAASTKKCS